ncbi:glycosyltransferase involved in cell wall biosynthesis [Streptomyces sp. B4I13]|uniref:glycosyltransferase family 4 protein n=1 Tax=Streptomyces sp. B4I13 TaxID=3042271 RepID=UPI00278053E4|nr:glycosyltransferase family 4 protein [Streptomyces sp. B4I13]MDQ0956285.1 glycosyltransferase involved in cell wall biosynthesis [Streptomyces sp. B4I13]
MRIWIFNHYAAPPDCAAGTRHYELGRVLATKGHDVTVFASSFSHFSRREERLAPGEKVATRTIDGVHFVWVRTPTYTGNGYRRVLNMAHYAVRVLAAQRSLNRPDVIVGSSVHLAAVLAAWRVARARHARFVVEVRDLWPQTLIDMGALRANGLPAKLLRLVESFCCRRASAVICLLPGAADYLEGRGVPTHKIHYVPNGIADLPRQVDPAQPAGPNVAHPGSQAADLIDRIRRFRKDGCLTAGYIGSHGPANGVATIVSAAAELRSVGHPRVAVVLVGDGQEKAACLRLAHRYGLDDVLFWPPVPKQAVPAVLAELDVTLFCLRDVAVFKYGLSSNKLFDYLASGKPVLFASNAPGGPVRESGGGVCVPAESPEAVAGALAGLAAMSDTERERMGERGRRWVYRHHGMTSLADAFLAAVSEPAWRGGPATEVLL